MLLVRVSAFWEDNNILDHDHRQAVVCLSLAGQTMISIRGPITVNLSDGPTSC